MSIANSCEGDIARKVALRAVEWLVELQDTQTSDDTRHRFRQWLDAEPEHRRAWDHIEAVNGQLKSLASPASAAVHAALSAPVGIGRRRALETLALLLFVGGTGWTAARHMPWREWTADIRTGVGERRSVTLVDGTSISLNSSTAIGIDISAGHRRLQLVSGELLTTATGNLPPLQIATPQGELLAHDARFAVRLWDDAALLSVFDGSVAIHAGDEHAEAQHWISAGHQARFTAAAVGDSTSLAPGAGAWVDGMLVASNMRLADFLAELGRHRSGRLRCDPALADLRLSGTYPLADTDRVLAALTASLPVQVHYLTRYWVTVAPV